MNKKALASAILAALVMNGASVTALAREPVYGPIPEGYSVNIQLGDGVFVQGKANGGSAAPQTASDTTARTTQSPSQREEIDVTALQAETIRLINIEREQAGLEPLDTDPTLTEMAEQRAAEVAEQYSHTRPDGSKCFTVFDEYDTGLKPTGENIAGNFRTAKQAVAGWMKSDGHRANILNETATYLGVGVCEDENGKLAWVQIFAK